MPLRFRSVVPYTLPGVLALIGCWWYISRKKGRLTSHDSPEGDPPAVDLTSPSEGSNGLVEKVGVPLVTGVAATPHQQVSKDQRPARPEVIAQVHMLETKTSPTQEHGSAVAAPHPVRTSSKEIPGPLNLTLLPPGAEGSPAFQASEKDHVGSDGSSAASLLIEPEPQRGDVAEPASAPEPMVIEAAILPCQSIQATYAAAPTAGDLSNAERPEPEGEVASQAVTLPCGTPPLKDLHDSTTTKDELVSPVVPVQSVTPEADSLEATTLPELSHHHHHHHHALTSISTSPAPSPALLPVLDRALASEDSQGTVDGSDEQEFELLAAGLITEVISAATLEVLGDSSCLDAGPSLPGYSSSTPLANGRPFDQQPPNTADMQQRPPPLLEGPSPISCDSREAELVVEEHRMPNGFSSCSPVWKPSEDSHEENELENVRRSRRPTGLPQVSAPPSVETGSAAEDSACSTCHSDDGVGNKVPQSSTADLRVGLFHVTDASRAEPTLAQPAADTGADVGMSALAAENVVHAVYDMKRFNGIGLGNGIGEIETDQSGGSDVNSMDSVDSGCTMGPGENQSNNATSSSSELIIWEIEVPKHLVGRLIGKQGRYVSFLKQNSGAKIYISTLPYTQEFQICHIEGTQQQVDKALSLIGKKFKDLDLTNLYAPPPLTLPSLPMTSWLLLPSGVTVEVIVVNIVSAGHVFVQQHTHPTYHALRSLDQQMFLCYSQPGTPGLPSPAEVGVICAAPALEGAWWRAQVITFYKDTNEVEIRYVDYGGYDRVKIDSLRQIRSDFVTLPFQGAEVLLDNIAPLPGEDRFSTEATSALEEVTRGVALLAQVSNYDNNTGLPLVQLWNMAGEELISVNRTLAERGLGTWVDSF